MCEVRTLRSLPGLLPAIVVLFASTFTPATAWGQVVGTAEPSVPVVNTRFDGLNNRLGATADRLLATPIPSVASPTQARSAVAPSNQSSAATATPTAPERHRKADLRIAQLRPIIDPILRKEGVPPELAAVALIESGGQPAALSPKGARGIWQLMPETARRYGLVVTEQRDERLDLVNATQAAARYLHDLYAQFGNWELALAAYNAGEQAVNTAIERARNSSFAVLSQLQLLPAETRRYVPAVLSASGTLKQMPLAAADDSPRIPKTSILFALAGPDQQIVKNAGEGSTTIHP